jgi:hypothetical protein
VYLPGLRADVGAEAAEEVRFFDFFLPALVIVSAMVELDVKVVVLGFFFAGELDGEDELIVLSTGSLSPSNLGLLISLMMSFRSTAPLERAGSLGGVGRGVGA